MDEATRATIRKEFKSRIIRAMIGIPIISAMLLIMWLADDHHGHYLWLTVFPLVFLVPLYRNYLVIRRLTEPESSAPNTTAPVDVPAANAFKAKVRSKATFGFGINVAILILMSSYVLGFGHSDLGQLDKIDNKLMLTEKYLRVSTEFLRYWMDQGTTLAAYPPPERADDQATWAANIEEHFGHPVSVFLIDTKGLLWEKALPSAVLRDETERYIAAQDTAKQKPLRTFGSIRVSERSFKADSVWYNIWIAERTTDGKKWGAVFTSRSEWQEFFNRLSQPNASVGYFSSTQILNHTIALPGSTMPEHLPGLRAFLNDTLIFASPGLDLGRDSIHMGEFDGRRFEFFAAPQGRGPSSRSLVSKYILIPLTLLPLLLIFPLYRSYRRVRMLTNPD